jgi:hypothetical protein
MTTEECLVKRRYGVESETTVVLFNASAFFKAAGRASSLGACLPSNQWRLHDGCAINRQVPHPSSKRTTPSTPPCPP